MYTLPLAADTDPAPRSLSQTHKHTHTHSHYILAQTPTHRHTHTALTPTLTLTLTPTPTLHTHSHPHPHTQMHTHTHKHTHLPSCYRHKYSPTPAVAGTPVVVQSQGRLHYVLHTKPYTSAESVCMNTCRLPRSSSLHPAHKTVYIGRVSMHAHMQTAKVVSATSCTPNRTHRQSQHACTHADCQGRLNHVLLTKPCKHQQSQYACTQLLPAHQTPYTSAESACMHTCGQPFDAASPNHTHQQSQHACTHADSHLVQLTEFETKLHKCFLISVHLMKSHKSAQIHLHVACTFQGGVAARKFDAVNMYMLTRTCICLPENA